MLQAVKRFDIPVIRVHLKALLNRRNLPNYQKEIRDDVIQDARDVINKTPEEAAMMLAAYYLKFGNFGGGHPDTEPQFSLDK